jgi:PTH2 family peptidyl-tRNA hydrolase
MKRSKQVIVIRKDLNMRKGKMIAQGAHASLKAVLDSGLYVLEGVSIDLPPDSAIENWVNGQFTKITVSVDSEKDLLEIYQKAVDAGLISSLIRDAGLTEFNEPTLTCCAIGPAWSDEIDSITGHLKLL